jgi:hypothetical protein
MLLVMTWLGPGLAWFMEEEALASWGVSRMALWLRVVR